MAAFDSVLLIGFGGPTRPDEIRPFLENVVRGRNISPERLAAVARHYQAIGGRSPYNERTIRQSEALRERLARDGLPLPVYVGMRNWRPFLAETLAKMRDAGRRRVVGVILAPHRSDTSWERYQRDVDRAREACGGGPAVEYLPAWHTHPLFVEAMAQRVEEATGYSPLAWPLRTALLFSAHSIPVSMARTSRYAEEVAETAAAIAARLGAGEWRVVFQSASGGGVPWLGPDVNDAFRAAAAAGARQGVLVPAGFLCDHVEVLYDLDVEAAATAAELGVRLVRCRTVEDHPLFIRMLSELVRGVAAS